MCFNINSFTDFFSFSGGSFISVNRWAPYTRGNNGGGSQPNFNFYFGC